MYSPSLHEAIFAYEEGEPALKSASRILARFALPLALVAAATLGPALPASATTTCTFTTSAATMTLDADCTTDQTILVQDGFTLDGAGHTITAVDPAGGHFVGAVVKNGGTTAHVTNLGVTASGLANVCDAL